MKCLSIRQPWATLIVLGVKRLENRSWSVPASLIGERIAIHASAGPLAIRSWSEIVRGPHVPADEAVTVGEVRLPALSTLPRGVILGTVQLQDCLPFAKLPRRLQRDPFAEPGGWCWILANAVAVPEPFACKGALRLWDVPAELRLDQGGPA